MPVGMHIVAKNIDEWKRQGFATAKYLSNKQLVNNVGTMLKTRFETISKTQFSRKGGFGKHGTWPSLDPKYAAWKAKKFPGKSIMRRTDKLYNALVGGSDSSVFYSGSLPSGFNVRYGVDIEPDYPSFHQQGGSIKGSMKMRKVIDPTEQQLKGIGVAIARTLEEGLFSRLWFDIKGSKGTKVSSKFLGFDKIDIP